MHRFPSPAESSVAWKSKLPTNILFQVNLLYGLRAGYSRRDEIAARCCGPMTLTPRELEQFGSILPGAETVSRPSRMPSGLPDMQGFG
jgi:hypothetical protein